MRLMSGLIGAVGITVIGFIVSQPPVSVSSSTVSSPAWLPSAIAAPPLKSYDGTQDSFPLSYLYPPQIQPEIAGCADEGCGFPIRFIPTSTGLDEAEIHIYLPRGTATAADLEPFVLGERGLMASNQWPIDAIESGPSVQFPYPWVKKVIRFSTDREESGVVLLGEVHGQAVQLLLRYPAEMSQQYWDSADVVLKSLRFNADRLPLQPSSEGQR